MFQGFCGICYAVCTGVPTSPAAPTFSMTFVSPAATAIDGACANDWIQIPCAMDYQNSGTVLSTGGTNGCLTRICGNIFSAKSAATSNAAVYSKLLIVQYWVMTFYAFYWIRLPQTLRSSRLHWLLRCCQHGQHRILFAVQSITLFSNFWLNVLH